MLLEIETVKPFSRPNYLRRCQSSFLQGKPGLVNKTRLINDLRVLRALGIKELRQRRPRQLYIEKQRRVIDLTKLRDKELRSCLQQN